MEVTHEGGDVGESTAHCGSPYCLCLFTDSFRIYPVHSPLRQFFIAYREILSMVCSDCRGYCYRPLQLMDFLWPYLKFSFLRDLGGSEKREMEAFFQHINGITGCLSTD